MGALSVVTLLLGVLREFVIARDLQASGAADMFFRGLVIVGACRHFGMALFRARWIPVDRAVPASTLLRRELPTCGMMIAAGIIGLVMVMGFAPWRSLLPWVFVLAVTLATLGSAVRALAERAGYERRGFVLEWALPLGTVAGALGLGHGALGPAVGITGGLAVGMVVLAPLVFARRSGGVHTDAAEDHRQTRWLLLDTLLYVNLGLLDAGLSPYVFDEGGFALLNYAYLFVNAALAVPMAAATVVALRIAATKDDHARVRLRRWALAIGGLVGGAVLAVWAALAWEPVAGQVDLAAGWAMSAAIRPVILMAVPFAALRLANTIGRQMEVAHNPRLLLPWDLGGLVLRAGVLVLGSGPLGVLASPLGLVVAELVQLGAWVRPRRDTA